MKTIAEQIKDLEATRAAKAAQMGEIAQKSIDDDRSMDEAEAEEFDTLEGEIKQLDQDISRLRKLEALNLQKGVTAVPAGGVNPQKSASAARGRADGHIIVKSAEAEEKFQGQNYTRMVIAKALAHLEGIPSPAAIAQQRWGKSNPTLVAIMKANEVAGGGSGSGEWGAELVSADNRYTGDFISFLNAMTVFDKLGLREVPANVAIKGQDGASTGYWVGESKPIPVTTADFSSVSLTPLKVAALAVVSNELLRDSSPAAEALVRDALVEAAAQRIDTTFLSTTAASSGVSPAGLLNGLSAGSASGVDGDALRADVKALYAAFITAKNASGLTFVMNPSLAKAIQLMTNALGQPEFPGMMMSGGNLLGDNVVTGDNVNANHLILLKPTDIYKIGDYGIQVSISRDAMIEMNSIPTGASDTPVAAATTPVSMFQSESTAIKIVRPMNFAKRRSSAVQYIGDADYGSIASA